MVKQNNLTNQFIKNGFIKVKVNKKKSLNNIREIINRLLKKKISSVNSQTLNNFHNLIEKKDLNEIRLSIFHKLNSQKLFRESYYEIAKEFLDVIVGNELVMQNKVNLSIQLPFDNSSLLPIHSDTWQGDSPFEVVVWLPLVNCYKTKSMFLMKPESSKKLYKNFHKIKNLNNNQIFKKYEKDLQWVNIKYGEILIFNQSLPHGNVVNIENETRWSMNCRFKSLFSPYGEKKLGEFFEPIDIKPATIIGLSYKDPNND